MIATLFSDAVPDGAQPATSLFGSAVISPCRKYRYSLTRHVGGPTPGSASTCLFVMLNPSTADEAKDDPTVRRCMDFARRTGHATLSIVNLFALRTQNPRELREWGTEAIGPDNDSHIRAALATASPNGLVIAAWGCGGKLLGRDLDVLRMHHRWHCLGTTLDRMPRHPLYLARTAEPVRYWGPAQREPSSPNAGSNPI